MKKLSYLELSIQALEALNRPATYRDVWEYIKQNQLYKQLKSYDDTIGIASIGKTPYDSIGAFLYTEAKKSDGKDYTEVSRPKYFLLPTHRDKDIKIPVEPEDIPSKSRLSTFHERDLHPLLTLFLNGSQTFNARSRTIYHEQSNKKQRGADKWLYPDMVAVNFEYADYENNQLLNFIKKFDRLPLRIYSFEIKIRLDYSNYKENFFQAVSNSSWANEGYLVNLHVDEDESFMDALQKLSSSFGIGVIKLDAENVPQSQVLIPARYKENIDYATAHELAGKNPNFSKFLQTVVDYDPKYPDRFTKEFDEVWDDEKLEKHIKDKKII